ncbi:unnamed protein product [Paramecium sonneborni]|uniref:Transmembrane protein n=1 Tax=Paramecium sonneborni TaxID=65129 RepID=A0A8S1P0A5_9CILI|nr:unnamed protein product [Paramecium sonneborni]
MEQIKSLQHQNFRISMFLLKNHSKMQLTFMICIEIQKFTIISENIIKINILIFLLIYIIEIKIYIQQNLLQFIICFFIYFSLLTILKIFLILLYYSLCFFFNKQWINTTRRNWLLI